MANSSKPSQLVDLNALNTVYGTLKSHLDNKVYTTFGDPNAILGGRNDPEGNPIIKPYKSAYVESLFVTEPSSAGSASNTPKSAVITFKPEGDQNQLMIDNADVHANSFSITSSRKAKENIKPTKYNALDVLSKVDVVDFNYKNDKAKNEHVGFIAEDTPEVLSSKNKDKLDVNNCIGILIKAIQELQEEVDLLKKERSL